MDMIKIKEQLKEGAQLVKESCAFLLATPSLIIYLAIPTIVILAIHFLYYLISLRQLPSIELLLNGFNDLMNISLTGPNWLWYIIVVQIIFGITLLTNLCSVALAAHTIDMANNSSIKNWQIYLWHAWSRILPIIVWSLTETVFYLLLYKISSLPSFGFYIGLILNMGLVLCWALVTFFVIPIIAHEKMPILSTIMKSYRIVYDCWWQALSGKGIIFIVTTVLITLFTLPRFFVNMTTNTMLIAICACIILSIKMVSSTVDIIFKSTLYYNETEPAIELATMEFTEF